MRVLCDEKIEFRSLTPGCGDIDIAGDLDIDHQHRSGRTKSSICPGSLPMLTDLGSTMEGVSLPDLKAIRYLFPAHPIKRFDRISIILSINYSIHILSLKFS